MLKAKGEDISGVLAEVDGLKAKVQDAEARMKDIDAQLEEMLLSVPNAPHASVPDGAGEEDNVEVSKWGEVPSFDFEVHAPLGGAPPGVPTPANARGPHRCNEFPRRGRRAGWRGQIKDHVDVGAGLAGMDFAQGSKISGSRFVVLQATHAPLRPTTTHLRLSWRLLLRLYTGGRAARQGQVARLHRALAQFMLDTHTGKHGYTEANVRRPPAPAPPPPPPPPPPRPRAPAPPG